MTRRVLRAELRHGPFWGFVATMLPVAVTVFPLVVVMVSTHEAMTWHAMARGVLSGQVPITVVLTLSVAAWQGDRERRRRMGELLGTMPRPRLHRTLAGWLPSLIWPLLAYTLGVLAAGTLIASALGAGRPQMVGLFVVAGVELAAAAALGFLIGRYVPGRFVAPVAGIVAYTSLYGMLNWVGYVPLMLLAPSRLPSWEDPVWWFAPAAAVWFAGLAAAALTGTAARRRWLALLPLAVAILAAVPITQTSVWRIDTTRLVQACGLQTAQRIATLPPDERRSWQATAGCYNTSGADSN